MRGILVVTSSAVALVLQAAPLRFQKDGCPLEEFSMDVTLVDSRECECVAALAHSVIQEAIGASDNACVCE